MHATSDLRRHLRRLWDAGTSHDRGAYRAAFRRIEFWRPSEGSRFALAVLREPGRVMPLMAIASGFTPVELGLNLLYGN